MVFPAIIALHWSLLDSMLCDNMNDALVIKTDLKAIIREDRCLSYIGEEAKISENKSIVLRKILELRECPVAVSLVLPFCCM